VVWVELYSGRKIVDSGFDIAVLSKGVSKAAA
jgi:hypothetical protein